MHRLAPEVAVPEMPENPADSIRRSNRAAERLGRNHMTRVERSLGKSTGFPGNSVSRGSTISNQSCGVAEFQSVRVITEDLKRNEFDLADSTQQAVESSTENRNAFLQALGWSGRYPPRYKRFHLCGCDQAGGNSTVPGGCRLWSGRSAFKSGQRQRLGGSHRSCAGLT